MEKHLGKEYPDKSQREAFLRDNCDKVEEKGYMKPFTPDQLQGRKEALADVSISIEETEAEKKGAMERFKGQLKPLEARRRQMVSDIKAKAEYVREICFKFIDQNEKTAGYYNSDGDLIESRTATADELQPTIMSLSRKTGTEG